MWDTKKTQILYIFFFLLITTAAFWFTKSSKLAQLNCDKEPSFQCYQNKFLDIAGNKGTSYALDYLAEQQNKNPMLKKDCHYLAHRLGSEAYRKTKNVSAAIYEGRSHMNLCETGYTHGVIIQVFQETKTFAQISDFCNAFPAEENLFLRWHCLHSTGHGLMAALNYDLSRALAECARMENYFDREVCYGGVFMELVVLQHLPQEKHSSFLRLSDPFWPCNEVDATRAKPCYYYTTGTKLYRITNGNLPKAFEFCQKLEGEKREYCYRGVGRVVNVLESPEPESALAHCLSGPLEAHVPCLHPLVVILVDMHARLEDGQRLCLSSPERLKSPCFKTLGMLVPYLHTKEKALWPEICQKLASNFSSNCLEGAKERDLRNKKWQEIL